MKDLPEGFVVSNSAPSALPAGFEVVDTPAAPDSNFLGDFTKGVLSGASGVGTAAIQRVNELSTGKDSSPSGKGSLISEFYKNVLPLLHPELATELSNINPDDVQEATAHATNKIHQLKPDNLSGSAGELLGQAAPLIAAGPSELPLVAQGAIGGAVAGALTPTTDSTVDASGNAALQNTALSGGIGAIATPIAGKLLGGISSLASPSGILGKAAGVNPEALNAFDQAGVTPNLAAVSDSPAVNTVQNAVSRFPGGSSIIDKSIDQTKAQITSQLNDLGLAKGVTPQQAGDTIDTGLRAGIKRGQDRVSKVYSIFDKQVSPDEAFPTASSQAFLDSINSQTNNPSVLKDLQGKQGYKLVQEMTDSMKDGNVDYRDIKYYRSKIGNMLGDTFSVGGDERPVLKQAYTALTNDMRGAAESKGPLALKAFNRSNELAQQFHSEVDDNLKAVLNKNAPEQMYAALKQGTKLGGTKADAIMGQLNTEQRQIVRGSVLKELGGGETFDPIKAITGFNKLAPEAKAALFKGAPAEMINSYNKLGMVVDRLNNVKSFSNPSGSGYISNAGLFLGGGAIGGAAGLASAAKLYAGANISARLMTSPKFINWLAEGVSSTRTPVEAASHFAKLQTISRAAPELGEDIVQYLTPPKQQQPPMEDVTPKPLALPAKAASLPGAPQDATTAAISNAAIKTGIDPHFLTSIALKESNGNPQAKNPASSASGLFQLTAPTWNALVDKYGQQYGITKDMVNDPQANATMGALYAKENKDKLAKALGRSATNGEVYMAHFLGPTGATKLINNYSDSIPAARLFPAAAKANRSLFFDGRKAISTQRLYQKLSQNIS